MSARARAAGLQDATLVETIRDFGWFDRVLLGIYAVCIAWAVGTADYLWAGLVAVVAFMWLNGSIQHLTKERLRRTLASLRGDL